MKKYASILLFLCIIKQPVFSQFNEQLKIDSLVKLSPSLPDTQRIDNLNKISYSYTVLSKKPEAAYFAEAAFIESTKRNYIHGIAESLSRQAGIVQHFENDFHKEEILARRSLLWYNKTANKASIEILYNQLAFSCFAQSGYDEALEYLKKEYNCYNSIGDESGMQETISFMAAIYTEKGDYDKGFELEQQSLELAVKSRDQTLTKKAINGLGTLCLRIEDYPSALHYYRLALEDMTAADSISQGKVEYNTWAQMEFAEIYTHLHYYDSALYRYSLFDSIKAHQKDLRIFLVSKGEYYLKTGQNKNALTNFLLGLYYHQKLKDTNEIMRTLLDIGKVYSALNKYDLALAYTRRGLAIALQTKARQFIRDGHEIMYQVFERLYKTDSAFQHYKLYISMKEIVANEQIKGKLASYNYENKIRLLNKEKQIQEISLHVELFYKKILLAAIFALLLVSFVTFRNIYLKRKNEAKKREIVENELHLQQNQLLFQKLESEKKQQELQHRAIDLEMQALRSQMNPHFIFNCLSSINRFILKNEGEAASDYLIKFSRLIRMVLINSKQPLITLEDELKTLKLYLEMERLRFKYSFDYSIVFKNEIDPGCIFIPPLLLQPFAENAIWHGLMNKEGQGNLLISLNKENSCLNCIIEDNGVGRSKAAELNSKSAEKKKSMGLQITKERLAALNKETNENIYFEVEDLFDEKGNVAGTRIVLKINLAEKQEEDLLIN